MSDEIRDHDEESIKKNLFDLIRSWDSVQIFTSREEVVEGEKRTVAASLGLGNWYARYGQVTEWLQNGGVMHVGLVPPEEHNDEQTDEPSD